MGHLADVDVESHETCQDPENDIRHLGRPRIHRQSTIADFDHILVLSDGQVAEFGTPAELWSRGDGVFWDMREKSGERGKLEETLFFFLVERTHRCRKRRETSKSTWHVTLN